MIKNAYIVLLLCVLAAMVGGRRYFHIKETPMCHQGSMLRGQPTHSLEEDYNFEGNSNIGDESCGRIIVVGDVHGSMEGLLEVLRAAKVIPSSAGTEGADLDSCQWQPQPRSLLLIQTGDIVDRGPNTEKLVACLQKLSDTVPSRGNIKFVRLLGSKFKFLLSG